MTGVFLIDARGELVHRDALQSLNAATATGAGTAFDLGVGHAKFGFQAKHTGGPTSVIVDLEGSVNGNDWFSLGTWDSASQRNGDIVFVVDKPVVHVRGNLTTLTGGSSPTVSAWLAVI